jgi:hypothetical protein
MGRTETVKWCQRFLVIALLTASPAQAVKLYKWVDENGSTHYHQEPPPKGVQFVEEIEFDGETNIVPGAETEAAREQAEGAGPSTPQETGQQTTETGGPESPTPQEKAAIAEETEPTAEQPIEPPDVGADPARGARTAPDAGAAGGGAAGASAGTAPSAVPAPAPGP